MRAGARATRPTTRSISRCRCSRQATSNARVWIRIREVEQSLALIEQILARPAGRADQRRPAVHAGDAAKAWRSSKASAATCWSGCGIDGDGKIARCHLRDPSWFQWPLLEAAIEGNIVADFPALQQIVQLLLFGARPLGARMRKLLLQSSSAAR